jgi:hypothetical protein
MASAYIDLNNIHIADRAIIIMSILRKFRQPGQKGIGANRDDHPLFSQITAHFINAEDPNVYTTELFQARHRVGKYIRQLAASEYAHYLTHDSPLDELLEIHEMKTTLRGIELSKSELDISYGEW